MREAFRFSATPNQRALIPALSRKRERGNGDHFRNGGHFRLDEKETIDPKRLRWRCRRGTRELDQLLGWWLTERYENSDRALRIAFAKMLELPDPDLWDWLVGNGSPADSSYVSIVDEIRAWHRV